MAAPKGNRFWEARSSHGRKPKFANSDDLWDACKQYFQWVQDNPLWEAKAFAFQGVVTIGKLPKMRAMTVESLCMFLDVDSSKWREWKAKRQDLRTIISRAEEVIRQQKLTGAAADLLNPNIIARDLGLVDKQQSNVVVKNDSEHVSEIDAWLEGVTGEQATDQTTPTRTH